MKRLKDGVGPVETRLRRVLDAVGVDPYDTHIETLASAAEATESTPRSRFWFRSPCWASRAIDFTVHVWLPAALEEKYVRVAAALRRTSPRWGVHRARGMVR